MLFRKPKRIIPAKRKSVFQSIKGKVLQNLQKTKNKNLNLVSKSLPHL